MSIRWMMVQFVGDTLRLPIVNKPDMDKPFGSSELEREVRRIVINPFSDNPQTFVPESENAKLREQYETVFVDYRSEVAKLRELLDYVTPIAWYAASERERDRMRELGVS